jgi:hypothetical protein
MDPDGATLTLEPEKRQLDHTKRFVRQASESQSLEASDKQSLEQEAADDLVLAKTRNEGKSLFTSIIPYFNKRNSSHGSNA